MAAQITVVPRVFLKPEQYRQSMTHTAYAPAPSSPQAQAGAEQPRIELTFYGGVAYDVEANVYEIFKDLGIATTERPLSPWERRFQER
jgi:hypothetical protein